MNQQAQHAFGPEEIMAYLDGELAPARALEVASHLDGCADCARIAEGIRGTSAQMREWAVEAPSPQMDEFVLSAIKGTAPTARKKSAGGKLKDWWRANGWIGLAKSPYAWSLATLVFAATITAGALLRHEKRSSMEFFYGPANGRLAARVETGIPASPAPPGPQAQPEAQQAYAQSDQLTETEQSEMASEESAPTPAPVTGPMIAQTASVTIVPTNYDQASADLEALAKAHGGYVQKLEASAQAGQARSVSATMRIPAAQLGEFLSDAKQLGHVAQFSQENEEVTDQYVDVTARLKSAKTTEQRLIELQSTRTGKLSDVLEVERELERVRGEIEQMEGEQAVLVHRVQYSSVDLSLQEEYRENLHSESTSKRTTIWNAVVAGFRNLEVGIVSLLVFLLAFGPSILFWLAIVGLPVWLIWRRRRRTQVAAK